MPDEDQLQQVMENAHRQGHEQDGVEGSRRNQRGFHSETRQGRKHHDGCTPEDLRDTALQGRGYHGDD